MVDQRCSLYIPEPTCAKDGVPRLLLNECGSALMGTGMDMHNNCLQTSWCVVVLDDLRLPVQHQSSELQRPGEPSEHVPPGHGKPPTAVSEAKLTYASMYTYAR